MSEVNEFNELLSKRIKELTPVKTTWVKVKEVNWSEKTMTATGTSDDLDFFNVLLGLDSEYRKPKVGSKALIGLIGNAENDTFLIFAEEVEEINIVSGGSSLTIKNEGIVIKQGSEILKSILSDFIDEVNKIVVNPGYGVGVNVGAVTAIKQRLNTVLKD